MVAIPIKFVVVIALAVACCCHCQSEKIGSDSSTWEKLQISPDAFSSVEYANFLIEIYEHTDNNKASTATMSQKKYFYSPLAILDHKSAVSLYNNVTNQSEMRFRIEMWNDKVQNEVVKHLKKIVGQEIKSNQIRVIPTKKILLTSDVPTAEYSISSPWTNYDKSKILRLSLSCFDQKICDKLANEMRSNPEQFDHFKLLFRLSSQTSQTKQATISIDSVTSGSMVSHLLQKFEDKNEIFLTANDEKKMLSKMATNILMEMFDDSEIASPDTENQIVNILKDLLITSRTTIKEQNDKMWDSVFWNDDNYRPDKTTKNLNEILNKLDKETQKKLANLFQKAPERQSGIKFTLDEGKNEKRIQHNYDANSWTEVDRISSIISGKYIQYFDTSVRVESLKDDVEKLLQQSGNHVQWDGEKFVPKLIQLSRINLDKFRDSQSFQNRNVRVRYSINLELSAPIKLMEHADLTVTDEWNNLKEQLKAATVELLNTTSGELSSVKLDLAAAVMKLEEMNNELIKVKRDFTIKLEATSELLNTTVKNLVKTNDELSHLKGDLTHTTNALKGTEQELNITKIELEKTKKTLNGTENELELMKLQIRTGNLSIELKNKQKWIGYNDVSSNQSAVAINGLPSSCGDLKLIGHTLNGFYSIKGKKMMESVYCDFSKLPSDPDFQKWIGYVDVKSTPVHFYVQRNTKFITTYKPIPFDFSWVNEGDAMNLTSGVFTAPRPGIYFFSFTGMAEFPTSSSRVNLHVGLFLNGGRIGWGYVEESNTVAGQRSTLTLQSMLNMKKGDRVEMFIHDQSPLAYLYDGSSHYTHFTGFMLQEEIVASL